jgi:hypothetical protein
LTWNERDAELWSPEFKGKKHPGADICNVFARLRKDGPAPVKAIIIIDVVGLRLSIDEEIR